ncbi:glycosyltransferase family 4 protein [Azospirillum himalayense]|uniref:Glycosyltransferase family 4 protein n=1 Tax=Azospirillum himalayense TaxID=654847 RepID=A0ABW0G0A1_9PROT
MRLLFLHQNFPGQYKHLARHFAGLPQVQAVALGEAVNLKDRPAPPGIRLLGYRSPQGASAQTHHYLRSAEAAVRRGQTVARACLDLKRQGFRPDLVCAHAGWGESLYIKDVFPDTKLLTFFEFYYQAEGGDLGFDPEFPASFDDRCRARTRNTTHLLSLAGTDWGITPTRWQHAQFPALARRCIDVVFDGIDTDAVTPDPGAMLRLADGTVLTRTDEVITYVARNLEPYRGFHVFMRALPEILRRRPKARVLIVGGDEVSYGCAPQDGRTWRAFMMGEVGARLDLGRVHFLGRVPYNRFLEILRVSGVHVYLTYPFVLSWSMMEAMAAGCAVVGSATGPVREVIADGDNGFLVDFFDWQAIADAVDRVFEEPGRCAAVRERARRTVVERYDLARCCLPDQLALLQDVLDGRRSATETADEMAKGTERAGAAAS